MFKWWRNHIEKQFRNQVRAILVTNVPDFEMFERSLPVSTVETAYATAWKQIGESAQDKHPHIYQAACLDAAEYIMISYNTWLEVAFGGDDP